MNLINLLGNLFGFSKRSSFLDRYDHRLKACQAEKGAKEGLKKYKQIYSDDGIKKKFPELRKSPRIYNPSCGKSYTKWKEEVFGRYSNLATIEGINKERVHQKYSDIENWVVLDKEAKNSQLKQCYEQIRRFDQIIESDLSMSEVRYNAYILKDNYRLKLERIKKSFSWSILNKDVAYAILDRENDNSKRQVIKDYFESRLKY